MRKEDEQAIRRALALMKIKCQEQAECPTCPLFKKVHFENGSHYGCVLDIPPAFMDIDVVIECFT